MSDLNPRDTFGGYGVMPGGSLNWLEVKSPGSFLDYQVDLARLYPNPYRDHEDPIIALSLSNKPAGDGELAPAFLRLHENGTHAVWWEWAGVAGRTYRLNLKAKTRSGKIHDWLISQVCDPSYATYPLPPAPIPGFGPPRIWSEGDTMFCPTENLPSITVGATGTTQLTAAVVTELGITLVNSGGGGGVLIAVPIEAWRDRRPVYTNESGGAVTFYLYGSNSFSNQSPGEGVTLQNTQSMTLSVAQSGLVLVQN